MTVKVFRALKSSRLRFLRFGHAEDLKLLRLDNTESPVLAPEALTFKSLPFRPIFTNRALSMWGIDPKRHLACSGLARGTASLDHARPT
jgi:hypothetical protein